MDWRHNAVCRDEDPDLFFPIGTTGPALLQIEEAKSVCRRCPVMEACLQWALESGQVREGGLGTAWRRTSGGQEKRPRRPANTGPAPDRGGHGMKTLLAVLTQRVPLRHLWQCAPTAQLLVGETESCQRCMDLTPRVRFADTVEAPRSTVDRRPEPDCIATIVILLSV
ncbi:hypothetical protein Shyd_55800 [Streptomyces hydrogenans]|uniref:4Fe-4S Wbl-type domain-containing protein n=1 Tax=Streptomyces hydrogenans TaxID=1873719 RepID=A0ABQ3PGR2_9ACTN|nr:hypothetical protein Shyd_55800 [Streptomyces hydrogenans]